MVRLIESLGILTFFLAWSYYFYYLTIGIELAVLIPSLLLSLLLGLYFGDLISGLIHWACDSFGSSQTPLIGPAIIHPCRYHHQDPLKVVRESLIENLGVSCIAGSISMLPLYVWLLNPRGWFQHFALQVLLWTICFSVLSNLFHRWAHIHPVLRPHWISMLQKMKICIAFEEYCIHHQYPYQKNYCILSGITNSTVNQIPLKLIESKIAKLGIKTHAD